MSRGDASDGLDLFNLVEDPARWEAAIVAEQERARRDPEAARILASIYCEEDRETAFARFRDSFELDVLDGLLRRVGVGPSRSICEIGGGPGWLGWGLRGRGFTSIEMLEPNGHHNTGTGYLRTRQDARDITIWNDLGAWYADDRRYDAVITHNCAHHFKNLSHVAACIRKKIAPGGAWLMVRESYADSAAELYYLLRSHPYCQRYKLFEFSMPAAHYIEALEIAGFRLSAVVPAGYANDTLALYVEGPGGLRNRLATRLIDAALAAAPRTTAMLYRAERLASLLAGPRFRRFTRPQAVLFHRVEVEAW